MKLRVLLTTALLIAALMAAPATAATGASKKRSDVWVGQVVRHHRHFDYQGSSCPTRAEACIMVLATFRIVPLNPKAAVALRRVSGGSAKLVGYRGPAVDRHHNGVLYVRRVKKVQA